VASKTFVGKQRVCTIVFAFWFCSKEAQEIPHRLIPSVSLAAKFFEEANSLFPADNVVDGIETANFANANSVLGRV
jgi:hypothetical protein